MNLIYIWFLLSGAATLIYEVAWQKLLVRLFGSSLYAVATITSVFLVGLSIGAALAARWSVRAGRPPSAVRDLKIYGSIEIGVAVLAGGLPFLFASNVVQSIFVQSEQAVSAGALSLIVRALIAAIVLMPPTILLGATFPVMVAASSDGASGEGRTVRTTELLYAFNTAGAVLGCLVCGFLLLPYVGLSTSCLIAAGVNALIGISAVACAPWIGARLDAAHQADKEAAAAAAAAEAAAPQPKWKKKANDEPVMSLANGLVIAFGSGLISLALEVCWTRWFQLLAGSSAYSLTLVLACVLSGLALGAWITAAWLRPLKQAIILASTALALSAIYIIISIYAADEAPWLLVQLIQTFANLSGGYNFVADMAARFTVIALNVFVPSVLMGTIVPLLFECVDVKKTPLPARAGLVYAANTIGTVLGACLTGFFLIPGLSALTVSGIQMTVLMAMAGQTILSFYLFCLWSRSFINDSETRMIVNGIVGFLAFAVVGDLALFRPSWNQALMASGVIFYPPTELAKLDKDQFLRSAGINTETPEKKAPGLLFYREGLNSTVTVQSLSDKNIVELKNDGKIEAAVPQEPAMPARGSDVVTHAMLGYLPALLHKGDCANSLLIGYGSGTTCGAALSFPKLQKLRVCELEPAILAANKFFINANGDPLRDELIKSGKVQVVINDGRYVLLTSPQPYDAIISQPAEPWVSGSSALFTEEFWQLARGKLAQDGMFCQWVQLYSISPEYFGVVCRTFAKVFPECILVHHQSAGECILIGFNGESNSDPAVAAARLQSAHFEPVLKEAGLSTDSNVLSDIRLNAAALRKMCDSIAAATGNSRLNTDDNMLLEYAASKNAVTQHQNIDANIDWIRKSIN